MRLLFNGLTKLFLGFLLLGGLLFLPAWTFTFPGAWLFLSLLFFPMLILGAVLFFKAPALLEKRLNTKEKEKTERGVLAFSALIFPAGFIISAFDFRFSWSAAPLWLTVLSSILFLFGYAMYAEVMRENAYLSRTVEIQENQRIIDTGLYAVVRHPMYLSTLFMFLPIPFILGSLWGVIPFLLYPFLISVRILDEERVLSEGLSGYIEYKSKVKYRLIPFVW